MMQRNPPDFPWCKANNHWCSVVTSFLGGTSDIFLRIWAHKGGRYNDYGLSSFHYPEITQDARPRIVDAQLTLRWCSFVAGSNNIVSSIFAHNGRQYYDYGQMPFQSPVNIQDARPEIVGAPLMPNSIKGRGACRLPFYLLRLPIHLVWMDATMQLCDCWMGKTINHWCSIDAHLWAHLRVILSVIGCSTIVQKRQRVFIGSQYTSSM